MHSHDLTLALPDEATTNALGAALAPLLTPGMVIWLCGDLGAGKTALVRAVLRARGISGPVKSPTYTLVEVHPVSGIYFYHFDFYRFNHPDEYLEAGLDEYFSATSICLVEWPDKAQPHVPAADIQIDLRVAGSGRLARLHAGSVTGRQCLSQLTLPSPPGKDSADAHC
jgi:tRNA threonylcarbamoyladenosine biosynthesis protein TsaE